MKTSQRHGPEAAAAAERRASPRIAANLAVQFQSDAADAVKGAGIMRNVSAGGLYFRTGGWDKLAPGVSVRMRLLGRSGRAGEETIKSLRGFHGRAVVVRVDTPTRPGRRSRGGVALRFESAPNYQVYRWTM
jgi:hypothetical protein